jgi:C1A family cysteine protease
MKGIFVSPQNAVSCSGTGSCDGGSPLYFFRYTNKTGIVASSCIGYKNAQYDGTNPTACPATCDDGKTNTGQTTRYFTATPVQLKGREVIKQEIMANGPVNMHMQTYADLMFYQRGIYHNVITKPNGGHAVKCVGWGYDKMSKTEYWIVANRYVKILLLTRV